MQLANLVRRRTTIRIHITNLLYYTYTAILYYTTKLDDFTATNRDYSTATTILPVLLRRGNPVSRLAVLLYCDDYTTILRRPYHLCTIRYY